MNADLATDLGASLVANLEKSIGRATDALLARQHDDGHWAFELEADATIPAEYVLLKHFLANSVAETDTRRSWSARSSAI